MIAQDLFADLLHPVGEIRPDSPAVRPSEFRVDSGVSPDSLFSPIRKMADEIAQEHGITPEQALELLDDDDKAMIQAGDQPTIEAWRCAVESRARRRIAPPDCGPGEVIAWTPAGNPIRVKAEDAEHAAWIARMNPEPAHKITCASCRHAKPTSHPVLVNCGAGRMAPGASGLWWGSDRHECTDFKWVKP